MTVCVCDCVCPSSMQMRAHIAVTIAGRSLCDISLNVAYCLCRNRSSRGCDDSDWPLRFSYIAPNVTVDTRIPLSLTAVSRLLYWISLDKMLLAFYTKRLKHSIIFQIFVFLIFPIACITRMVAVVDLLGKTFDIIYIVHS